MNKHRWLLVLVPLVIIAALALRFHRLQQAETSPIAELTPWALETGLVGRGSVAGNIQSAALLEAPQQLVLSPQIAGTVLAIGPRAGIAVAQGELLVRIDARTIARDLASLVQQRAAAQADADYAVKQQQRLDALLLERSVSQSQADQGRALANSARAKANSLAEQTAALRVQLGYAEICAPQDAVVAERLVEVGDTVAPGTPVYRLTAGSGAVVRVALAASQLAQVHVGDRLELHQGDARIMLRIARVAPAVNAAGLGYAEADADQAPFGLPSGSVVSATLHGRASTSSLTVPMAALVGSGSAVRVLVLTPGASTAAPGRLRWVAVKVLAQGSARAAVEGALQPDELVAVGQTAVLTRLRDGDWAVTVASVGGGQ